MGDLKGHALPGTIFLLYGIWWAICSTRRYLMCRRSNKKYISTSAFGCPCPCARLASLPAESCFKVGLGCLGMFGEIIANLPYPSMGIIQHSTMYFFFVVAGLVDIVLRYSSALPPGTDYVAMFLAVGIEGLLFANHLHGRPPLDVHIHTLLVYVVFALAVVLLLECKFQNSFLLTLCRSYLTILQGTWFWALGIILYGHGKPNSAWDYESHEHIMTTTIYFSWHCASIFVLLLCIVGIMSCAHRCFNGPMGNGAASDMALTPLTMAEMGGNGNGHYKMLKIGNDDDDDESDIEYEKPVEKQLLVS